MLVVHGITLWFGPVELRRGVFTHIKMIQFYFFLYFSHVINELIETERVYVEELFTVLTVSPFFRLLFTVPWYLAQNRTCRPLKPSKDVVGQVSTRLSNPKLVINVHVFSLGFLC